VYRSGQTGQTVNLMAYAFVGSNPAAPITPEIPATLRGFSVVRSFPPAYL
jgi:hypothetical protein